VFGPSFFGASHYGPTYFPPGGEIVEIEAPAKGGGAGTEHIQRKDLIEEENEIIMAVIMKFLDLEG